MNNIMLLSIKTKYANQIFDGIKKFEFRRKSIGEKNCNKKIFIYSSEEEKSIVGYIIVDKILVGNMTSILERTGYSEDKDIIKYFDGCEKCYALEISCTHRFKEPIPLKEIKASEKDFVVPQFYRYIKETEYIYNELLERE